MKNKKYVLMILIPMHLGVLSMFWLTGISLINFLFLFIGWTLIAGLGVNVGLHRWASHRAVKLNKYAKPIIVYLSVMACQGQIIWWAAVHRGVHHKYTDTIKDHHSPQFYGIWHSFIGWILTHDPNKVNYKYSSDLLRDSLIKKTTDHYEKIIWCTWILTGLINIDLLLWMFLLPAFLGLHSEGLINALCHGDRGYRNFDLPNKSTNLPLLGYLTWGNGWHNNHHAHPSSYDFGKGISGKLTEFDPCVIFLPLIKDYNAD
jgi:sn-1 stearoyl-lipid 9-desaturase